MTEIVELEKKLIEQKNQLTSQLMKPIKSSDMDQEVADQHGGKCNQSMDDNQTVGIACGKDETSLTDTLLDTVKVSFRTREEVD